VTGGYQKVNIFGPRLDADLLAIARTPYELNQHHIFDSPNFAIFNLGLLKASVHIRKIPFAQEIASRRDKGLQAMAVTAESK
jgi:hypothetical protein